MRTGSQSPPRVLLNRPIRDPPQPEKDPKIDEIRDRRRVHRSLAEGRKWRDGIHQAIEQRGKLKSASRRPKGARITVQDFVLRYPHSPA